MFSGFIGDSATNSALSGAASGTVDSMESVFAHIILTLMSLAIIWVGVKAAVNYDEVTKKAFEPFGKLGDSVTNFVQHIPSYIPTPHPAFAAAAAFSNPTAIAQLIDKNVKEHTDNKQNSLTDILDGKGNALNKAVTDFKNNVGSFEDAVRRF